jgi:hypothetical protein
MKHGDYHKLCWISSVLGNTWSRVLEKLIVVQLVKKFLTFHGTRRFITVFTRTCHQCLS